MNYDSRYVLDWTDHVWCEAFSESQQRWFHLDPCENTMDKPLIYENGWGKKLIYIIAFSSYECIDVTWRYSNKFQEVIQRRNECDEDWLVDFTNRLSKSRQVSFDEERKHKIKQNYKRLQKMARIWGAVAALYNGGYYEEKLRKKR